MFGHHNEVADARGVLRGNAIVLALHDVGPRLGLKGEHLAEPVHAGTVGNKAGQHGKNAIHLADRHQGKDRHPLRLLKG